MHTYPGREVEDWFDDSDSDDHADDNTGDDGHHEKGPRDSDLDLDDEDRAFMALLMKAMTDSLFTTAFGVDLATL
ncbi:hypothetical protein ZWY2020_014528 [Hordeum vulgare]|nr:hypothetical protein ZWY2020_014528 [Hordeum vulgare]